MNSQLPPASVLARFALFVNGMARAVILPFGPSLVYRLVNGTAQLTPSTWSSVSFNLAMVFISFIVGYSAGARVASQFLMGFVKPKLHVYVARIGGAAIALHLFSCGAGITSVSWLVAIRFASAVMVGILCSITDPSSLSLEDVTNQQEEKQSSVERQTGVSSATAKVFLSGFAVSILGGGLSYRSDFSVETMEALAGGTTLHAYGWSIVFLLATTVICEIALRGAFSLTTQPYNNMDQQSTSFVPKVQKIVRRIVEGKPLNSNQRVSFKQENQSLLSESSAQRGGDPLRPRTASYASATTEASASDYFDCNSEMSDDDNSEVFPGENSTEIAQYRDGKCCYSDGSPAYVPLGESATVVPQNYLDNCHGNHEKAMKMWQETQKWRKENDVWKIHSLPNDLFFTIKGNYPHSIVGHTKTGLPVVIEQPGNMNVDVLFGGGGCKVEDMVHHFIFFQEYMCNVLCPSKELRRVAGKENEPFNSSGYGTLIIMDIKGAGLGLLNGDVLRYLKKSGEISGAHYPMSIKRVCVVNCPFWATAALSTIKRVLPETVTLDLLSGNGIDGLRQYIDDDQIPKEYGGSSPYSLGQHPYEKRIFKMAEQLTTRDIEADNDISDDIESSSTPIEIVVDTAEQPTPSSPETERPAVDKQVRRRAVGTMLDTSSSSDLKNNSGSAQVVGVNSLAFISFFTAAWSCAQGAIEIATPLWLTSPCQFGGLGYTPPRSGFTMFLATLAVLSILTTKASQTVFTMHHTEPLRGLRIGLCVESAVLFLMTVLPIYLSDCPGDGSVVATTSAVFLFTVGAMASILGRSSSTRLCEMVSDGLPPQTGTVGTSRSLSRSIEVLIAECASGRATKFLCMVGEIVGMLIVSLIWALSIDRERPSKYDGSLCVLLPALATGFLYFVSFFLQLNATTKPPLTPVSLDGSFAGLELGTLPERKAV